MASLETKKELSDDEVYNTRCKDITGLKEGFDGVMESLKRYPHTFERTKTFTEFINEYKDIPAHSDHPDKIECLAGRVVLNRGSGKLIFMTLQSGYDMSGTLNVQVVFSLKTLFPDEDITKFKTVINSIKRGDIIGVKGNVMKTKMGELSLLVHEVQVLTPCLRNLPKSHFGLLGAEQRGRNRFLDLIVNKDSIVPFVVRSKFIRMLRNYLEDDLKLLEVDTPVLSTGVGGASAKPFETVHNDHKINMFMRISPELYLKQLVVGGFDECGVYEIGHQFRNESITYRHNPEFTSLEFYKTYTDYNDLMEICEDMLCKFVMALKGNLKFSYTPHNSDKKVELDFTPPFRRLDMIEELEKATSTKFPTDLGSDEALKFLDDLCVLNNVSCEHPRTHARLLDKLCGEFIETQCLNPTFIMHHPVVMSPLAKWHRDKPHLTERFELFINYMEFANAYTELNNPFIQRNTFEQQMKDKAKGDAEVAPIDETFISALEYGLPPTGGFGLGIDRFVMLLADKSTIADVLYFPTYKPT